MSELPLQAFHECAFTDKEYKRLVLNKLSILAGGRIPWVKIFSNLKGNDAFKLTYNEWKNIKKSASRSIPEGDAKHFMSLIYWLYNVNDWKISQKECKNCADEICELIYGCSIDKRYERLVRKNRFSTPPNRPALSMAGVESPENHPAAQRLLDLDTARVSTPNLTSLLTDERLDNNLHYSANIVDVLGRDREQHMLRAFLANDPDKGFLWLQLAGAGGQGKSRLAFDLVAEAKKDNVWDAGFLSEKGLVAFEDHWPNWQPPKPTLIVIDYILGRERLVAKAFQALTAPNKNFKKPVRLLLVERQRWDRGGLERLRPRRDDDGKQITDFLASENGKADWFSKLCDGTSPDASAIAGTRFKQGVIELEQLDPDDLVSLVEEIARMQGATISMPAEKIKETLYRIDKSGRPLFAYLLALRLVDGRLDEGWTRESLLTQAIEREQQKRWAAIYGTTGRSCPSPEDNVFSMRIARVATMIEGYDNAADEVEKLSDEEWAREDKEAMQDALILVDAPRGSGARFVGHVPPLQPDLLGEWFVLWSFAGGLADGSLSAQIAWKLRPDKMAAFLQRCVQDFPHRPETMRLLEILPADKLGRKALRTISAQILTHLLISRATFYPENILAQVKSMAVAGQVSAMFSLGACYLFGAGVAPNAARAAKWMEKAAEGGSHGAMFWHRVILRMNGELV